MTPLDPNRRPEVKTQHVYRCAKCRADVAFIARLPAWLEKHMSITAAPDCGGRLIYLREEPRT